MRLHIDIVVCNNFPCFKQKFGGFREFFSIASFVVLIENSLLTGNIFELRCQDFELRYTFVIVGQFYLFQVRVDLLL